MALIICTNCGKKISDKAKECIHCQYPIQLTSPTREDTKQTLTIISNDQFLLFDPKVEIYINESFQSTQSIKNGFRIIVPIESKDIKLKLSVSGWSGKRFTELDLHLDPEYSYQIDLIYDDAFFAKYSKKYSLKSIS